jgi:hypothetical protein
MALAELAKAGVAFTSDVDEKGKTIYIIDKIRLTEDEVILLHKNAALTPDGIRHYLVDRAA